MAIAYKAKLFTASGNTTSSTTFAKTTTSALATNDVVLVWVLFDNLTTNTPTVAITNAAGNITWTTQYTSDSYTAGAGSGIRGAFVTGVVTGAVSSGDTFTATFSAAISAKLMGAHVYTGVNTTTPYAGTAVAGTSANANSTATSSYANSAGDLKIGLGGLEYNGGSWGLTDQISINGTWVMRDPSTISGGSGGSGLTATYHDKITVFGGVYDTSTKQSGGSTYDNLVILSDLKVATPPTVITIGLSSASIDTKANRIGALVAGRDNLSTRITSMSPKYYYPLDDSSTTTATNLGSVSSANGTYTNGVGSTKLGFSLLGASEARAFDGVDDYVAISSSTLGTYASWTISAVVAPYNSSNMPVFMPTSENLSYKLPNMFMYTNAFAARAGIQAPYSNSPNWYTASVGTSVADIPYLSTVTYDGTHIKAYRNGFLAQDYVPGVASGHGAVNSTVYIGRNKWSWSDPTFAYYSGGISDVAVWDRALTESEVLRIGDAALYVSSPSTLSLAMSTATTTIKVNKPTITRPGALDLPTVIMSLSPKYYYKLDDTGSTAVNSGSVSSADGTYNGSPAIDERITIGSSPTSHLFDGIDDFIEVLSSSMKSYTSAWTVSAVVNLTQTNGVILTTYITAGGQSVPIALGTGVVELGGNNQIKFGAGYFRSANSTWYKTPATNSHSYNVPYLVTAVYNGTTITIYKNGISDGSTTPAQPDMNTGASDYFRIGRRWDGTTNYVKGNMSDVAVWDRALTTTEITKLADANNVTPSAVTTIILDTATITVQSYPVTPLYSVIITLPTAPITVGSDPITVRRYHDCDTSVISIQAEPISILINSVIYCEPAEVSFNAEEITLSVTSNSYLDLETAHVDIESLPVMVDELLTLTTAEILVEAIPVTYPIHSPTAVISIQANPISTSITTNLGGFDFLLTPPEFAYTGALESVAGSDDFGSSRISLSMYARYEVYEDE